MYRGFVASLAPALTLLVAGCGGKVSGEGTGGAGLVGGGSGGASAGTASGSNADTGNLAGAGTSSGGGMGQVSGFSSGTSGSASALGPSPCGAGASTTPVSFSTQLMPIFQGNCSVGMFAECHGDPSDALPGGGGNGGGAREYFGPPTPAPSSAATLATIYKGLVGQVSWEDPYMNVVTPGDLTQSFLWYKINGTQGSLDNETPNQCARGDLGTCGAPMSLSLLNGSSTPLLPQADLDLICNWIVQGASAGTNTSVPPAIPCFTDTDCPGTTCGSQVCNGGACTPAATGPAGQDGFCNGTPNCKCASFGATCGTAPFPGACSFTTPPAGGSGSSTGASSGLMTSDAGESSGSMTADAEATSDSTAADAGAPSFADVYNNIGLCSICLPCHAPPDGDGYVNGELDLSTSDTAYANLVGVPAAGTACGGQTPAFIRVVAGNAAQSLLYDKLNAKTTGTAAPCGNPEPEGSAPALSPADMAIVESWINDGANP
jgi:hypothetical protein